MQRLAGLSMRRRCATSRSWTTRLLKTKPYGTIGVSEAIRSGSSSSGRRETRSPPLMTRWAGGGVSLILDPITGLLHAHVEIPSQWSL